MIQFTVHWHPALTLWVCSFDEARVTNALSRVLHDFMHRYVLHVRTYIHAYINTYIHILPLNKEARDSNINKIRKIGCEQSKKSTDPAHMSVISSFELIVPENLPQ